MNNDRARNETSRFPFCGMNEVLVPLGKRRTNKTRCVVHAQIEDTSCTHKNYAKTAFMRTIQNARASCLISGGNSRDNNAKIEKNGSNQSQKERTLFIRSVCRNAVFHPIDRI